MSRTRRGVIRRLRRSSTLKTVSTPILPVREERQTGARVGSRAATCKDGKAVAELVSLALELLDLHDQPVGRGVTDKRVACAQMQRARGARVASSMAVSRIPSSHVTSTAHRQNVVSQGFGATTAVQSGCSCSLVAKETSVLHVMPSGQQLSPLSYTTKSSRAPSCDVGFYDPKNAQCLLPPPSGTPRRAFPLRLRHHRRADARRRF